VEDADEHPPRPRRPSAGCQAMMQDGSAREMQDTRRDCHDRRAPAGCRDHASRARRPASDAERRRTSRRFAPAQPRSRRVRGLAASLERAQGWPPAWGQPPPAENQSGARSRPVGRCHQARQPSAQARPKSSGPKPTIGPAQAAISGCRLSSSLAKTAEQQVVVARRAASTHLPVPPGLPQVLMNDPSGHRSVPRPTARSCIRLGA
jgi:hypothetical protein